MRMAAACPDANAPLLAEAADAIEQHEAYKQAVSDALESWMNPNHQSWETFAQFIIPAPKPDPLVEILVATDHLDYEPQAEAIYAALDARGLEIRDKNDDR